MHVKVALALSVWFSRIVCQRMVTFRVPIPDNLKRAAGVAEESLLNFTQLADRYGYKAEEHKVVTDDEYVLTIFRIPKGKKCVTSVKNTPVILMHGVMQDSDSWLDMGPDHALGYLLPDACFDVWFGNVRGNDHGRQHQRLNPDQDPQFWEFYAEEMGVHDVPAIIDYVLLQTGAKKLNYVGYSQGTQVVYIMCSENPTHCSKLGVHISLAPVTRLLHTTSAFRFAPALTALEGVINRLGFYEFFPKGGFTQEFISSVCSLNGDILALCANLAALFTSVRRSDFDEETAETLVGHTPAGTSVHNMAWLGQAVNSVQFQKFDYGPTGNMRLYGSEVTPQYNISAIIVPEVLVYSLSDNTADPRDVEWLARQLPHLVAMKLVADPLWNHYSYIYSRSLRSLVFPTVNEYLNRYS